MISENHRGETIVRRHLRIIKLCCTLGFRKAAVENHSFPIEKENPPSSSASSQCRNGYGPQQASRE